jgi:hypothetical protein
MDTATDLAQEYETEVLGATWEGFTVWLESEGIITMELLKSIPFDERETLVSEYWNQYVEDLQTSRSDYIQMQQYKYGER